MNLIKCSTIGEMITTVKMFYYVERKEVGMMTKILLINGLKAALNFRSPETEKKLKDAKTFGAMLDVIKSDYGNEKIKPEVKTNVVNGFHTALKMTGCEKKN